MKENMKKRLAVFLCILFVLPAIMAVLPQTAQEVQAAKASVSWNGSFSYLKGKVTVETGAAFYIGDYASVHEPSISYTVSMLKASYSTDNKGVASVNNKGYVTAKKPGSAKIKIKCKGKSLVCTLTVVEAGSFETKSAYKKLEKAVKPIEKNMPSKITTNNGFRFAKIKNKYKEVAESVEFDITDDGFIAIGESYVDLVPTNMLAVPKAGRIHTLERKLNRYAESISPFSTTSSKVLKIASVSANADKVTITLERAASKEQVIAAMISSNIPPENNKVYFRISIYNKKNWQILSGIACMKAGSRTVTIVPWEYNNKKEKYVKVKLKKNTTYRLESINDWTQGKTFKI